MTMQLKKIFFTGLLIWTPVIVTVWIIKIVVMTLDGFISYLPAAWQPTHIFGAKFVGIGFMFSVVVLFLTGVLGSNYVGRRLVDWGESIICKIPIVSRIYSNVKQVSDTLLLDSNSSFGQVVLVDFFGSKSIAFVTGQSSFLVTSHLNRGDVEYLNVFVPTTPNPTSGYMLIVPSSAVVFLSLSVEQALKHVISMGSVNPETPEN
ncbi:DUF502 domain-containing protein [Candidatus Ichthyocystis hellenicum]|nr:DUF502 domain-containing protein [Candidatus Ichthyocystis hellenicum]